MSSKQMQQFLIQQMAEASKRRLAKSQAGKIAEMAPGLIGQVGAPEQVAPYQQTEEQVFPGEAPIQGLMDVTQEAQPGTGLFSTDGTPSERFLGFNQRLMESGMPSLQKQGLENIASLQGDLTTQGKPSDPGSWRTFSMGADKGQMQRAFINQQGEVEKIGQPFDPRNPFLKTGTEFIDPNTGKTISRERREGARQVAEGTQEELRRTKNIESTWKAIDTLTTNLQAYDQMSTSLAEGADVGAISDLIPSFRDSTLRFKNAAQRLGLGVISSVTFGALSEAEMKLAMSTAVPPLGEEGMKEWLIDKAAATRKLRTELEKAAIHYEQGGTRAEWLKKQRDMKKAKRDAGTTTSGIKYKVR